MGRFDSPNCTTTTFRTSLMDSFRYPNCTIAQLKGKLLTANLRFNNFCLIFYHFFLFFL